MFTLRNRQKTAVKAEGNLVSLYSHLASARVWLNAVERSG